MDIQNKVSLVKDTITNSEIDGLITWLKGYPRLTKGEVTKKFEVEWSKWLGVKYSVFVNSGSSANLAMFYALKLSKRLRNNNIIVPCVSWVTSVSPVIQLGMNPILCDASSEDLGLDVTHFEKLCKEHNPSCVLLVHILGFPNDVDKILKICKKYDIIVLEDSCETVGSLSSGIKTGNFGVMSTFSTYFGHHFSTVEGGLISTNDFELYEILLSIRSHGWSRDLSASTRDKLQKTHNVDDFRNLYTFYHPGFNLRATEIQAFLGVKQLETLDAKNDIRYQNLLQYDSLINNDYWKIKVKDFISNFSYPIIHPCKDEIVSNLTKEGIECRPLVCGNIARQPFYTDLYGVEHHEFADKIHDFGLYVPNHPEMTTEEITNISTIINQTIIENEKKF
tara:strand:- start:975 stop:2153 length:1179 start_codon:yes stop_codon:yes gene_type:complete